MPTTPTPIFPQTINTSVQTIAPGDTTTIKTLYTAGANGSKVESIWVTNTDSSNAYTINVYITQSATNYLIGTVNIPLSSGNTTAAPTVNLLGTATNFGKILDFDSNNNTYLYLSSASTLKIASTSTVATSKTLTFVATGGDY